MKRTAWLAAAMLLLVLPEMARGASLELMAPDQTCRIIVTAANPTGTFSIVAVGAATATCCHGFTGAEFRVAGLTTDWMVMATPNPSSNVVIGNPFGDGVNIAFGNDLMDPSVLLFSATVTYVGPGDPPPATLHVVKHNTPSNPFWPCPRVWGGGGCPCWATACVTGGFLYINGDGDCLVGLEPSTWSSVKRLYQQ